MKPRYEVIKESPEFIKDSSSRAILNRDMKALAEYKKQKARRLSSKNEILKVQDDINTLKNEIKDIKDMFGDILTAINSKEK